MYIHIQSARDGSATFQILMYVRTCMSDVCTMYVRCMCDVCAGCICDWETVENHHIT